jgi:CubicO group peptidase (beta-lactamase class C family)
LKRIIFTIIALLSILNCKSQNSFEDRKIIHEIDSIRQRFHIPGLVFGVATIEKTLLSGALGIREINTTDSVTINDMFHIASLGKGFTSFIAGKLVDEGKISWNTRFFNLYPEMRKTSGREYLDLELKDLLSHRTMLPVINDWEAKKIIDGYNKQYPDNRFSDYKFTQYVLTLEPEKYDSAQFYRYTSMGYVLAALMLEKASGLSYKQLVEKTNSDLDVNFTIGWPQDFSKNQPYGHLIPSESGWGESNKLEVLNGDRFTDWGEDFLHYLIPSGHHSVTIADYLKYLQLNLKGLDGQNNYLKASTYDFIFNGAKEYSMGWGNEIVNGNNYYSHSGSAGNYYANAVIIKEPGIVISVMANAGNGETKWGLKQIIGYLENKYATEHVCGQ